MMYLKKPLAASWVKLESDNQKSRQVICAICGKLFTTGANVVKMNICSFECRHRLNIWNEMVYRLNAKGIKSKKFYLDNLRRMLYFSARLGWGLEKDAVIIDEQFKNAEPYVKNKADAVRQERYKRKGIEVIKSDK